MANISLILNGRKEVKLPKSWMAKTNRTTKARKYCNRCCGEQRNKNPDKSVTLAPLVEIMNFEHKRV